MNVNATFREMAATLAGHGFLAELIYTMQRQAKVNLGLGEYLLCVVFEDLADLTNQALAAVLDTMALRLKGMA